MIDPAIAGLIGTGVGGLIGLAGTVASNWSASKREERARLFTEKKKTYAEWLLALLETIVSANQVLHVEGPDRADAVRLNSERFRLFCGADNALAMLGPSALQEVRGGIQDSVFLAGSLAMESSNSENTAEERAEAAGKYEEVRERLLETYKRMPDVMREDLGAPS